MRRKEKAKIALIVALIAIIFVLITGSAVNKKVSVSFPEKNVSITAEVADTPYAREKGLMFVKSLPENSGMFFVFESPQKMKFWMKNTLIPLDIIFVSENFTIVNVAESVQPCSGYCTLYYSAEPAKYVVETNAGFARTNGIKAGDMVRIG